MKHFFQFHLTGNKLFALWIACIVFLIGPYVGLIVFMKDFKSPQASLLFLPLLLLLTIAALLISFYMFKIFVENFSVNDNRLAFNGSFGVYIGKILVGIFLTTITLGIYGAWFVKNIQQFFIDNISYKDSSFSFKGKGGNLFGILLLTLFLPMIILVTIVTVLQLNSAINSPVFAVLNQIFTFIILTPYMYMVYKWMVNVDYKTYHISWNTEFFSACGKILLEILFTVITLGIYYPLAYLRLYQYFINRTIAKSENSIINFGFDIENAGKDLLFIWGQILLILITFTIYYPWAISKIGVRFVNRTYYLQE